MKTPDLLPRHGTPVLILALAFALTGCSSTPPKPDPVHQRGWIGGEYMEVQRPMGPTIWSEAGAIPNPLTNAPKHGLLITALGINTPAHLAGLREGDLVLELNHVPVKRLKDFRRTVDKSEPGSAAQFKVFQNHQVAEYNVTVGRETYNEYGVFAVGLPLYGVRNFDFWPNPSFSLLVLGFHQSWGERPELASVESAYHRQRAADGKYEPTAESWDAWLVIFGVGWGTKTLSQEPVPASTAAGESVHRSVP